MIHSSSRPVVPKVLGILAVVMSVVGTFGAFAPSSSASALVKGVKADSSADDWPAYLNGPAHSSYNGGATAITPSNVGSLHSEWRWLPPDGTGKNKLWASPTVMDGVVYIGSWAGWFYAVSEATQTVLWKQYLGIVVGTTCGKGRSGVISTATVTTDPGTGKLAVYVNAPNGYLYALDATSGTVLWKGLVGIPSTTQDDYYAWGSPLVTNGNVYIGVSSQCDNPLVQGGLLRFTQDSTGSANPPAATFHSLPDSVTCPPPQTTPGCGGSIWSSPALADDGSIFVTTGNGPGKINNPPYSASMVKLDPTTLAVLASFTIPLSEQSQDSDWGGSPTLFTATIGGVSTPMVGGCNKDGHYYGLRQSDLSMVWDYVMGTPNMPGQAQQCDAAAIWDGTHLIDGGGSSTTIDGTTYPGSVQSLYPATGSVDGTTTGKPIWQTGLPGNIVGSPTEDGAGVVAAQVYFSATGNNGVYLLSAATGAILNFIPTPASDLFGQAVWVGNDLLVGAGPGLGLTDYEATSSPPPTVTGVNPSTVTAGQSDPIAVTGTGFQDGLTVSSTIPGASFSSPTSVIATSLDTVVTVPPSAPPGSYDLIVTNPDNQVGRCTACLTVTAPPPPPPPPPPVTAPGSPLAPPVTGMASTPNGDGYWLTDAAGAVSPHGAAQFYGSLVGHPLNAPINHIVATPDGQGYWLVAADGGTFTFGDAGFYGSTGNLRLNAPVVDIAPTKDGKGYWLVASDGGIFSFGDAAFQGSMGGQHLNKPVVGISADYATGGYWLVATDGGIFSFGAPFFGSTGNIVLNRPVNGMAATADSQGYWLVASDGGIFTGGDAAFHGSTGAIALNAPVVGMATDPGTGGYWLVASDGGVFSFGAPFYGAG